MPGFVYRPRTAEQMAKRETAGRDYKGYLNNEVTIWKPKKGDNSIRILPATWDGAEHYGIDVWVHYRVGPEGASVLCLAKMKGQRCPICEERARLDRDGLEAEAKEMLPGRSVLFWILDRNEEKKGPQVWACPPTLDQDIVKVSEDKSTRTYYMIDDPDQGYDVYFDKEGEKTQTKYKGAQIARRASSVAREHIDFIVELPLPDLLIWRDYAEVQALFSGEPQGAAHEPVREEPRRPIERQRVRVDDDTSLARDAEALRRDDPPFRQEPERAPTHVDPTPTRQSDPAPAASGSSRAAMLKQRMQERGNK